MPIGSPVFLRNSQSLLAASNNCHLKIYGNLSLVDLHVAVVRGRQEALRVGREHQRPDRHGVALQLVHELGRLGVEHIDDPVDSPAGDVLSVRTLENTRSCYLHIAELGPIGNSIIILQHSAHH